MRLSGKWLMVIAGLLWTVAGINVVRMGLQSWSQLNNRVALWLFAGAILTFAMFGTMFYKITKKNVVRICNYGKSLMPFWNCMSLKSYMIMVFMITFGVVLRNCTPTPPSFIALFYTGLGLALFMAGTFYFCPKCQSISLRK